MPPWIRVPLGLGVMVIGYLIVKKTEVVFGWFGTNDFAEKTFGEGGSRFFYKLIGIFIVFIGMMIATNVISDMLTSIAKLLTNRR